MQFPDNPATYLTQQIMTIFHHGDFKDVFDVSDQNKIFSHVYKTLNNSMRTYSKENREMFAILHERMTVHHQVLTADETQTYMYLCLKRAMNTLLEAMAEGEKKKGIN